MQVTASLKAEYARFLLEPATKLEHTLRVTRAEQIRNLLAHPEQIDLETFTREIWRFGPKITFNSVETNLSDFWPAIHTPQWLDSIRAAIENGSLVLHGNYMWDQPTSIFDPTLADVVQKTANLHRALDVLNNPHLTPTQKVHSVMAIRGFAISNATALVCICHPCEYAVCNKRAVYAVDTLLGTDIPQPRHMPPWVADKFQEVIQQLRAQLSARDFLELDCFLDRIYCESEFMPIREDEISDADMDIEGVIEGRQVLRTHLSHERNSVLIRRAKDRFRERNGRLHCEVCGFDFAQVYGVLGEDYIEAHHVVPVSELQAQSPTHLDDLKMVCPNCHRMLHRSKTLLTVEELRSIVRHSRG